MISPIPPRKILERAADQAEVIATDVANDVVEDYALQSDLDTTNSNVATNTANIASQATLIANKYGLPANVNFLSANKNFIMSTYEGLMIQSGTSSGDVNPAGAFNGTGAGQKCWIGLTNYHNMLLSNLTSFSFTAKNLMDAGATSGSPHGYVYWNMHVNFKTTGAVTAGDYAILAVDDCIRNRVQFYGLSANHTQYSVGINDRLFKCVGGTGKHSGYANSTTGSNVITNVSNAAQLTVGNYFRQIPQATVGTDTAVANIPDGAKITAINVAAATVTLDQNVGTGSAAATTGNVNTTNGSATVTQVTTTGWAVNQTVTGAGIPAGTYIITVTGTSTLTLSQAATATATGVTLTRQAGFNYVEYGGMAPDSRASTTDGSTTITIGARTGDSVTTTADLIVGMKVSGTGVPANTFITAITSTTITVGNAVDAGTPTLSFLAVGKSGIPSNSDNFAIPLAKIQENNPNCVLVNTTPTVAGGWAAQDNGAKKDTEHAAISFVQGTSGLTSQRINFLKQITINSDTYNF